MAGHTVAFRFRMSHAIVAVIAAPNMLIWAPWRGGSVKSPVCAVRRWCAVRRLIRVEVRDLRRRPAAAGRCSWGQPDPGGAGEGGSSPDKAGTGRYWQMVRVGRA